MSEDSVQRFQIIGYPEEVPTLQRQLQTCLERSGINEKEGRA